MFQTPMQGTFGVRVLFHGQTLPWTIRWRAECGAPTLVLIQH